MQLSEITPEAVENCLRSLRNGENNHKPLLNLMILLNQGSASSEARELALGDLMRNLIESSYQQIRKAEHLPVLTPATREAMQLQLNADFLLGNAELEAWSAVYFRYMAALPFSVEDLSQAGGVVPQQFRRRIKSGLNMLVEKLRRQELAAMQQQPNSNAYLPTADYSHLIGVQAYLDQLHAAINHAHGASLVSLEGLGVIGKTALARAFVTAPETTQQWKQILWVSARQSAISDDGKLLPVAGHASTLEDVTARLADQLGLSHLSSKTIAERLEGIQAALNMQASLVVVDNLETVEEYQQLIPALAKLSGKSRFLITTRQTLRHFPYIHAIPLSELNPQAAYELMCSETQRHGRKGIINEETFAALYQLIGGIPLAIKLVAAQLKLRPLPEVLAGFQTAGAGMDALYRYLYWETWQLLAEHTRSLLLSFLPADLEGEDLEFINMMSGLAMDDFYSALSELDQFSLLEISGDALSPRYRLHRLTVTFLQTDILKLWDADAASH